MSSFLYSGTTRRPATNAIEAPCPNMELSRRLRFTKAGSTHDPLAWCVTAAANTASRRPPPTHASAECRYHQHATREGREQTPRTNLATGQRHTLPRLPSPSSPRQWHCLAPLIANTRFTHRCRQRAPPTRHRRGPNLTLIPIVETAHGSITHAHERERELSTQQWRMNI
jgi:hypothetical protein